MEMYKEAFRSLDTQAQAMALQFLESSVRIDPYGLCTNYSNRSPVFRKDGGCRCV